MTFMMSDKGSAKPLDDQPKKDDQVLQLEVAHTRPESRALGQDMPVMVGGGMSQSLEQTTSAL